MMILFYLNTLLLKELYLEKILLSILVYIIIYIIYKHSKEDEVFKLTDPFNRKIKYKILNILLAFVYLIYFYIIILILKILNIFKQVDLKIFYNHILTIINYWSFVQYVINIIFIFTIILGIYLCYKVVKRIIINKLLNLHIYLSQYNFYSIEIIQLKFLLKFSYHRIDSKLVYYINGILATLLCYEETSEVFIRRLRFFFRNLAIIILIIFVFYDIIFNDFVLTNTFYVMPFCFLYNQWKKLSDFYWSKDFLKDMLLSKYLYKKSQFIENDVGGFYMFEDNETCDSSDLIELYQYINNDFKTRY